MNNLSVFSAKRKLLISIVFGIFGLLLSPYGIDISFGVIEIDLPWSVFFPIIAAIAFGWRFGLVSGLSGGAFFSFLLWPNNAWANVSTSIFYLVFYAFLGLLNDTSKLNKIKKPSFRFLLIILLSISLIFIDYRFLFNPFLSLNSLYGGMDSIKLMPLEMLYVFIFKDSVNILILALVAETLIHLPIVRRLLGIPYVPSKKRNSFLFLLSIIISFLVCLTYLGLCYALLRGENSLQREQIQIAFLVIIASGFFVSRLLFNYNENQFNIQNDLNQSEEKFRALFENANDAIIIMKDNIFIDCNPKALNIFGCGLNDFLGKSPSYFSPFYQADGKPSEDGVIQHINNALKGNALRYNWQHIRLDGTVFEAEVSLLKFVINHEIFIQAFVRDISERTLVEKQLKLLSKAVEQSPVIVLITDKWGGIEYVNPKFTEVTGYSKEEVIGKKASILRSGKQSKTYYKNLWQTISSGNDWHGEIQNRKKNGELYWESVVISPIFNSNDEIFLYVAKEDITEKKQIYEDLIIAKEQAVESDYLKTAFLNNISHEIRTPFNGILGLLSVIQEDNPNEEERDKYFKIINKSAYRLMNTMNDIVEIAKIQSGQMKLKKSEVNICNLTEELYNRNKYDADIKGLSLELKNLPSEINCYLNTDYDKLSAILDSLINNGIKFTNHGGVEFGVSVKPEYLEFYIKDSGIGIPSDKQKLIFEKFMQVDVSNSRQFEGSGLGLSIAKAYSEMLGAKISIESKVGEGSVFYLNIPYFSKIIPKEVNKNIDTSMRKKNPNHKLKILITEDDEISEVFINVAIKPYGENVFNARNGMEAIEICRNHTDLDLIFMDIKMPDMDGYEASRLIREFNTKVIIIAQTAFSMPGDKVKAIQSGCNDYITKPYSRETLLGIIRKYFFEIEE